MDPTVLADMLAELSGQLPRDPVLDLASSLSSGRRMVFAAGGVVALAAVLLLLSMLGALLP